LATDLLNPITARGTTTKVAAIIEKRTNQNVTGDGSKSMLE